VSETKTQRLAHTESMKLHRVSERPYPALLWQEHAGDTDCGLFADNGRSWCWCDGYPDGEHCRGRVLRRCFFCFNQSAGEDGSK